MKARLLEIAAHVRDEEQPDRYGGGSLLEAFERDVAERLGKESAVFMPSGTMAQQIALRIHAQRRGCANVALHPQSHLIVSENNAMQMVSGLQPIVTGPRDGLFGVSDLEAIADPLAAVLVELPERNVGGALRPWEEVEALCASGRKRNAAMHLDGARIWECQPYYGKTPAQLAAPFDTVYVSFYKILNAIAGAALAGPKEVVDEARAWLWRYGGRLVQQYPMIVSAREGLEKHLPRIPLYVERAKEIASVVGSFHGVEITPAPPQTNMFHLYVRGDRERLMERARALESERSVRFLPVWNACEIPGFAMAEVSCGEGSLEITNDEIRDLFALLLNA